MIDDLPMLVPDAARGARTRARCHRTLAARRRHTEARDRRADTKAVVAERLLFAGVCVIYIMSMTGNVLRLIRPH
jgi:hypothetical protein